MNSGEPEKIREQALVDRDHEAMEGEPSKQKTRRHLLKVGAAAAGAALTGVLASRQSASAQTGVTAASSDSSAAILGTNSDGGPGVEGDNTGSLLGNGGPGVKGVGNSTGVEGSGVNGGTGVYAHSDTGGGVVALSRSANAVFAVASEGDFGFGGLPQAGVLGATTNPGFIGVIALHGAAGTGLQVIGKASFSTVGSGTFAPGANSAAVTNANVSDRSHVTVTLTEDPGNAAAVSWVERQPGTGFIVHATKRVPNATPFSFFIVEP
jgi:hypothetical protein